MRYITFFLVFFTIKSFAQNGTLELLNDHEFKYKKGEWYINERKTIKKSYQKQYTLELNKQNAKTTIEVLTLDHESKNKNYPDQKSGEMTSAGRLLLFKDKLTEKVKDDTSVVFSFKKTAYEKYKILLAKSTSTDSLAEVVYYAAARNVIHRFFVIGVSIENIQCKSFDEALAHLIKHIKKIKDNNKIDKYKE